MKRKRIGIPRVDGWFLMMMRESTTGTFTVTIPQELAESLGLRKDQLVALRCAKGQKLVEMKTDLKVLV